ncbi:hypothetical protein DXG01_009223 [Tephrocybe rancida]|nr:hypothetical protein DXG01_009223 [Tephrocybe rancida]
MAGAHDIDLEKLSEPRRDDHPEPLPNKAPAEPRDAMKFIQARGTQQREDSQLHTIQFNIAAAIFVPKAINNTTMDGPFLSFSVQFCALAITFAITGSLIRTAQSVYKTLALSEELLTMPAGEVLKYMMVYWADLAGLISSLSALYSILSSIPYAAIPYGFIVTTALALYVSDRRA